MDVRAPVRRTGLPVLAVVGTSIVVAALASMLLRGRPLDLMYDLFMFHNGPSAIVLLWMSWLVLRRTPRHGGGLVLLAIAVLGVAHVAVVALVDARLVAGGIDLVREPDLMLVPAALPGDAALLWWLMNVIWPPAPALTLTLLLLVFPDGNLPGRRWLPVVWATAAGTGLLMLAFGIQFFPTAPWPENASVPVLDGILIAGGLAVAGAAAASVVAFLRRWRRADPVRRRQFRVVGVAAVAMAVVGVATYPWQHVWVPAVLVAFNLLLVAYALAAARYRLHDLEPVLGRTAVGAILTGLVAAIYLAVVVGIGSLVGRGVESTWLPLLAVGAVALLIEPARRRVRRLVDRLLYGRRTDRTELLSQVAALTSVSAAEEVLGEVAQLLVDGTGAARAEVWLAVAPGPQLAAAAGACDEPAPVLRTDVVHQQEVLGELRLYARAAADLVPDAGQLLDDVAHSLGVVLRNARLTAALRAQLDELRRSRQRLVEAHDQARRGLERDIHDGAQARLIGLRLRVGVARALAGDGHMLATELDAMGQEVDAAVRSLRELARGLHPPILEQSGVVAALHAHLRDLPVPVTVAGNGLGRYPRAVEGAVYFACLEAVQNAIRHGQADQIAVELNSDSATLRFSVRDNGTGFDPAQLAGGGLARAGAGLANIGDRVGALGGWTRIDSAPGQGTRISGEVPAAPLAG